MKKKMKLTIKEVLTTSYEKYFNIIAVILIAIYSFALTPKIFQNDTYYTIKIGEHISNNGIDMQDPFSWHEDLAYTYPHWLYDYMTYQIYDNWGFEGIYLSTCLLAIILGVSVYIVNTKVNKMKIISFIITISIMYLIKGYIAARAQLATFILFLFQVYLIEKYLEAKKKRYAVGLIIIPILIANLHVAVFPFYFIVFLPYIAEYIYIRYINTTLYMERGTLKLEARIKRLNKNIKISEIKEEDRKKISEKLIKNTKKLKELNECIEKRKVMRKEELEKSYKIEVKENRNVRGLIVILIIAAFTGFLTPLGTTPYTYLPLTMIGNTTENIVEHAPMIIATEDIFIAFIVVIIGILMLTKTKIRLPDAFMLAGLLILTVMSRRQMTMFALVGSIAITRVATSYIKKSLR